MNDETRASRRKLLTMAGGGAALALAGAGAAEAAGTSTVVITNLINNLSVEITTKKACCCAGLRRSSSDQYDRLAPVADLHNHVAGSGGVWPRHGRRAYPSELLGVFLRRGLDDRQACATFHALTLPHAISINERA